MSTKCKVSRRTHRASPVGHRADKALATADAHAETAAQPACETTKRFAGWRKWALRAALLLTAPLLAGGLAEAVLRVIGYGHPTAYFLSPDGGRTLVPNGQFTWTYKPPEMTTRGDNFILPARKAPGTLRVFVFGESAAMGVPNSYFSVSRVLKSMLADRWPNAKIEIVNTAVMGIDSHAVLSIAQEAATLQPDVFIVYMGNNEAVGPLGPATTPAPLLASRKLLRTWLWVRQARVGQLIASLTRDLGSKPDLERQATLGFFLDHAIRPDDPARQTIRRMYRGNLREICQTGRAAGARVIVATVATNLRDFAPFASAHAKGLSARNLETWQAAFAAGRDAEIRNDLPTAVQQYRLAVRIDDSYADLHYRLAGCLAKLNLPAEAGQHYAKARDTDTLPFRCTGPQNDLARAVVADLADPQVVLVDTAGAMAIPGDDMFCDHAHLTFRGNYELARTLLPAVEAALPAARQAAPATGMPSLERCSAALGLTDWHRWRMAAIIARACSLPPFTNQSDFTRRSQQRETQLDQLASRAKQTVGQSIQAVEAAVTQRPTDWRLRANLAGMLTDVGQYSAAGEQWRRVLQATTFNDELHTNAALCFARSGLLDLAAEHFKKAIQLDPRNALAEQGLGQLLLARKEVDAAAKHLLRALELAPSPTGYQVVGIQLMRQGRPAKAEACFHTGLKLDCTHRGLHAAMAQLLTDQGRSQEAAKHARAAQSPAATQPSATAGGTIRARL